MSDRRDSLSREHGSLSRGAGAGHMRTNSGSLGRGHTLASQPGSVVADSVMSEGTLQTENTYQRQFKPSFSNYSQYIFTVMAAVISAKEIWRFPYSIIGHDSGVFILLYVVFTLSIGIPVVYLELIIGTRFRLGAIQGFAAMSQQAVGVGVSHIFISFCYLIYQPMVMAWSLYYIYISFSAILPWTTCPEVQGTISACCVNDPSTYYWFERVLNVSTGLRDPEPTHQQHLILCFLLAWFLAFLCLVRGIRLGAYISYFTVTIPLLILPAIFVRVMFLEGAVFGLQTFITPDPRSVVQFTFPKLLLDTVAQILNTCGVTLGILMTFKARSQVVGYPTFEALLIGFMNMFTSIVSGAILYAIIGHHMTWTKRPKEEMFVSRGSSIMFSAFPSVFEHFMVPNLWSVLFFLALVLISLDTMYCQVNAITLSLMEVETLSVVPYTTLSVLITIACVLAGLPMVMGNGVYLFEELDSTVAPVICTAALIEVLYVSWFYGLDRLNDELYEKTELRMNDVWKFLLKWFIPITLSVILIAWAIVSLVENPSYMKYVGCPADQYKGLQGSTTFFRKTYLSPMETMIEWAIFVLLFLPIPFFVWYYWPKNPNDEYEQFQ